VAVIDFLGVDCSTLLDWIHAFNERGIDGLIEFKKNGRPRELTIEVVKKKILPLVTDTAKAGRKYRTAVKLQGLLKDSVCKGLSYSMLLRCTR
jgi:transposase